MNNKIILISFYISLSFYIYYKIKKYKYTNGLYINNNIKYWYKDNLLHRIEGPAVIDGSNKEWWENGERHRLNGPAIDYINHKEWWINGKCHRDNGPAVIKEHNLTYYKNGKIHRDNGPAIINQYGKFWVKNDEKHREDGPAYINGEYKVWYINDIKRSKEWIEKYLKIKEKHILLGVMVSDKWKIKEIILRWRYNPKLKCVQNRLKREFNNLFN